MSDSNVPMVTNELQPETPKAPEEPKPAEAAPKAEEAPRPKARRGFAVMDRTRVRAIARKGGVSAHAKGTAHEFTSDEARDAGRKGGLAMHRRRGPKPKSAPDSTPQSSS